MWFPPVKTRIQAVRAETDKNRKGAATVIYGYVCKAAHRSASNRWSCVRYNSNNAWIAHSYGIANANNFYNRFGVSAVSAFLSSGK